MSRTPHTPRVPFIVRRRPDGYAAAVRAGMVTREQARAEFGLPPIQPARPVARCCRAAPAHAVHCGQCGARL